MNWFEHNGIVLPILMRAAELGEWGIVWSLLCVSRVAFQWTYDVKKSNYTGRRQLGGAKMLGELLGPRRIEIGYKGGIRFIRYYERDRLHRTNGPAEIYAYSPEFREISLVWYTRGIQTRTYTSAIEGESNNIRNLVAKPCWFDVDDNRWEKCLTIWRWFCLLEDTAQEENMRGDRVFSAAVDVETESSETETESDIEIQEPSTFYEDAYAALDASNRERRKKRKEKQKTIKRRVLRKRGDSEEDEEE